MRKSECLISHLNGDGYVSPLDALLVINDLNGGGSGEGESPATIADAAATSWTFVANTETSEPVAADFSAEERASGSRVDGFRQPTSSFLQSLDLLFAKLDDAQGNQTRESVTGRRVTNTGDLEEFLDSMLNGIADAEKLFATAAP